MPLQNRVSPDGEIVATPERGIFMGNRGCLHDARRRLGDRRWSHRLWIVCRTAWNGRRRELMRPGHYTELFFLDEAVALAAGHRPCGECRNADYRRYKALWAQAHGGPAPSAAEMDRALHAARVEPRTRRQVRHAAPLDDLPDGAFVRLPGEAPAFLVLGDRLLPFSFAGYGTPRPRPRGATAEVATPRPTLAVLAAGYRPVLHPTAAA